MNNLLRSRRQRMKECEFQARDIIYNVYNDMLTSDEEFEIVLPNGDLLLQEYPHLLDITINPDADIKFYGQGGIFNMILIYGSVGHVEELSKEELINIIAHHLCLYPELSILY